MFVKEFWLQCSGRNDLYTKFDNDHDNTQLFTHSKKLFVQSIFALKTQSEVGVSQMISKMVDKTESRREKRMKWNNEQEHILINSVRKKGPLWGIKRNLYLKRILKRSSYQKNSGKQRTMQKFGNLHKQKSNQ